MPNLLMTPEAAVDKVTAHFPFENYIGSNRAPWLTVGEIVNLYLEPGQRLFDLESGPCDKTAVAQFMGVECHACDDLQDDWHNRGDTVAQIEAFAAEAGIQFSRKFEPPEANSFDMIMMNDVLEHIHDSPRELLNELLTGLKTGGFLFATVPNLANIRKRVDLLRGRSNLPNYEFYFWHPGTWRGPQREYVRGDLVSMCQNLGIEVVELRAVHHMLQNLPSAARMPYKLATAVFQDWRDTWLLVARKPDGWVPQSDPDDSRFKNTYRTVAKSSLYGQNDQ